MVYIQFFILFCISALGPVVSLCQDKDGFVLVKQEGNITLYERWLTYPSSDPPIKAREIKGIFYYNNTVAQGLRLLRDEKRALLWKSNVEEFRIFPTRDSSVWHEYSFHNIPWPVNDQDHYMEYKVTGHYGNLLITFQSKVDDVIAPERDDVNRILLNGSWRMEQISPTRVKVTYKVFSKPVGIPKAVADPFIRNNFITTFQDFIAVLEKTTFVENTKKK